jgi:osmoprotectant transport system ATP-binding protein
MEKIRLRKVTKRFGDFEAVRDLSLDVHEGETMVLIGTSGCGKTTTMKMINRLVEPTEGEIEVDGRNVLDFSPVQLRRGIGYVIQSIGLFPHMTIGRNVGMVPELMGWPREKTASRSRELLSMVGLDPDTYFGRYPAELSGGQQQRVGVARALAADPPVVLMDEPFGALDPITREQLQNEFLALVREIKKTIIFVTHDIFEAVKIADRIALMDRGRTVQVGSPKEIVESPASEFVSGFLGRHRFHLGLLLTRLKTVVTEAAETAAMEGCPSLGPDDSVLDALNCFKDSGGDYVAVRDAAGGLMGVVTRESIHEKVLEQ